MMFRFIVTFWDDGDSAVMTEKGFVAGENYGEAANRLVEYYGEENIVDINLCALDNILTDEEVADTCAS